MTFNFNINFFCLISSNVAVLMDQMTGHRLFLHQFHCHHHVAKNQPAILHAQYQMHHKMVVKIHSKRAWNLAWLQLVVLPLVLFLLRYAFDEISTIIEFTRIFIHLNPNKIQISWCFLFFLFRSWELCSPAVCTQYTEERIAIKPVYSDKRIDRKIKTKTKSFYSICVSNWLFVT